MIAIFAAPVMPGAGVEIEPKSGDLVLVRGIAAGVVGRMSVDDEKPAEPLSRTMLEKGPAHPRPVAIFVELGQRNVPGDGEKGLELDLAG